VALQVIKLTTLVLTENRDGVSFLRTNKRQYLPDSGDNVNLSEGMKDEYEKSAPRSLTRPFYILSDAIDIIQGFQDRSR
jgi:hypothetical protein